MKSSVWLSLSFVLLFMNGGNVCAYMGVILEDTRGEGCQVIRGDISKRCTKGKKLYKHDRLKLGYPLDEFKYHLYSHAKLISLDDGEYLVVESNEDINKGWMKAFVEDQLGNEKYYRATTAVRGDGQFPIDNLIASIKVTPPSSATVLPDIPITFRWRDGEGEAIVIENDSGDVVFSRELERSGTLDLVPAKANLRAGQRYVWYYRGDILEDRYELYVLNPGSEGARNVVHSLQEIPKIKSIDDAIYVASYLQVLSDINDDLDLYWLSYQVLTRIDAELNDKQVINVKSLLDRFYEREKANQGI